MEEEKRKKLHHCGAQNIPRFTISWCLLLSIFAVPACARAFDYADALTKSLLYFESQRSGRLPYNQRVTWRDHSGLTDGLEQELVKILKPHLSFHFCDQVKGGLGRRVYDAGDHVGDGDTDHYCWQRPEDMTTSRQAYKIDKDNPGSDLAGETAAAMAAASMVFKQTNPHYSHLLLHHAQQLFEFGDEYRGKYDASVEEVKSYYASVSGYMDELLWAALWLYKATDKEEYLRYVVDKADSFGGIGWAITEFSWEVKYAGLQVIASKLLAEKKHKEHAHVLEQYRSKAEYYICSCLDKNINGSNVERTPGGLLYVRQWNNMQYVSTAAFLLTVYSDFLQSSSQKLRCHGGMVGHEEILDFAKSQIDYILGSNPMNMSYLAGYGSNYPTRVHHRAASIVSYRESKGFIGCTQGYDYWYSRLKPNPNVLVGALVGGPDLQDDFVDRRSNYMQTEACTYNTAPLVGVLAKLLQLQDQNLDQNPTSPLLASY
ncbi:Endoglucanase 11 [Morella rubra]|uniref:cellulase n=1 Tax=Morella rubra TaxID=262757 RepID=A0A6A1UQB0_9ROSI|nr:Endoglucanase 11 [Morella rubra]